MVAAEGDQKGATKFDSVELACPDCNKKSKVLPQWADKAKCPDCGTALKPAAKQGPRVPKILKPPPNAVKCDFCEAVNPKTSKTCSVCKEPLGQQDFELDLALRDDEFKCPRCGTILGVKVRVCSGCAVHFCRSCKKPMEGQGPLCPPCQKKAGPPPRRRRRR